MAEAAKVEKQEILPWEAKARAVALATLQRGIPKYGEDGVRKGQESIRAFFATIDKRIPNPVIREWVCERLMRVPICFWVCSASSTNKYHPQTSKGIFGLLNHTTAVMNVMATIAEVSYYKIEPRDRELLVAAAALHDSVKRGTGPSFDHTVNNHPQLSAILAMAPSEVDLDSDSKAYVAGAVRSHMGEWGKNLPGNLPQALLHTADMLASREYLCIDSVALK